MPKVSFQWVANWPWRVFCGHLPREGNFFASFLRMSDGVSEAGKVDTKVNIRADVVSCLCVIVGIWWDLIKLLFTVFHVHILMCRRRFTWMLSMMSSKEYVKLSWMMEWMIWFSRNWNRLGIYCLWSFLLHRSVQYYYPCRIHMFHLNNVVIIVMRFATLTQYFCPSNIPCVSRTNDACGRNFIKVGFCEILLKSCSWFSSHHFILHLQMITWCTTGLGQTSNNAAMLHCDSAGSPTIRLNCMLSN